MVIACCAISMNCLFAQSASRKGRDSVQGSSAAGRRTFESTCASCHGLDGRGGERGPDIATRTEVVRLSDAQLARILRTGIPQAGMPAFAALGSAQLSATVNHLRSLQGKVAGTAVPGNAVSGKNLFAGKAGCSECHMVQGLGGFLGPDLSNYGANHSVAEVRDAIVSADKRSNSHRVSAKATTKDGHTIYGVVRNEDNFSIQLQSLDGTLHLLMKSDLADFVFDSKSLMPADYATKLSKQELDHLVAYLTQVARAGQDKETASSRAKTKVSTED